MAEKTLEEIETELTSLDKSYEEGYAGKDRHSVDTKGLDALLARVASLQASLDKLGALTGGDNAATVASALANRKELYDREKVLVSAAREMGPAFEKFSGEGAAANFVFDR